MAQLLSSNVAGSLNVSTGNVSINASPTNNTETRALTGLSVFLTASTLRTSNVTMNAEANLTLTLNEVGAYKIDGLLLFQGSTANGAGGIQFDFGGGSATVNSIAVVSEGYVNSSANILSAVRANNTAFSYSAIDGSTVVDWIKVSGMLKINAAGTFIPRYAQATSSANSASLLANSYLSVVKIG